MFTPFADPARAASVQGYVVAMDPGITVAIRDELTRLVAPTLIVWGTDDEFFDVSWARWLEGTIPGALEVVLVDGGRLFFPYERPDALNAPLRSLWSVPARAEAGGGRTTVRDNL
jgi:pimeloyl-ACP methyl ester carboxylesterase